MTVHLNEHWPLITVNTPNEKALVKAANPRLPAQNPRRPFVQDACPEHASDTIWQKGIFVDTYI